ncbi:carbohydrate binding [Branchiostoma belcheri]|nr:carbohydrate binding [Branchiostoma belcheri]
MEHGSELDPSLLAARDAPGSSLDPARDLTAARPNCKSQSAPYRKPHGSRRETDRAPNGSLTETGRQGDQNRRTLGVMTPASVYTEDMPNRRPCSGNAGDLLAKSLKASKSRYEEQNHAFEVIRTANQQYLGVDFFAIEAKLPADGLSATSEWCRDYQNLCAEYGLRPTGCGADQTGPNYRG